LALFLHLLAMLYEVLQEVPAKLSPGKHSEEVDASW